MVEVIFRTKLLITIKQNFSIVRVEPSVAPIVHSGLLELSYRFLTLHDDSGSSLVIDIVGFNLKALQVTVYPSI